MPDERPDGDRYPELDADARRRHLDELAYMHAYGFLKYVTPDPDPGAADDAGEPPETDAPSGPYLTP